MVAENGVSRYGSKTNCSGVQFRSVATQCTEPRGHSSHGHLQVHNPYRSRAIRGFAGGRGRAVSVLTAELLHPALAALAALLVTALLVPLLCVPAQKFGLVDHPTRRKRHGESTPMSGGLAIAGGLLVGLVLAFGADWGAFWSLPAGALVLLLLGVVDDIRPLSALFRLVVQLLVSTALVLSTDIHLHLLGEIFGTAFGPVGLGPMSAVFTILCITFLVNAVNMTDGLDGLAGGLGFFILILLAVVAALDSAPAWLFAMPLLWAAALSGFLLHNARSLILERARAFLGDSGSMMLGYALAWLAIALVTREGSGVTPVTMVWLLLIPAMDTLALFCRRILQGRSPFSPDRAHLHHILERMGQPPPVAVHRIHLAVFATGLFGILGWQTGWPEWLMFGLATGLILAYIAALINAHRLLRMAHRIRRRRAASRALRRKQCGSGSNLEQGTVRAGPRNGGGHP